MKFRLNRQLVSVATTLALLVALVAGVALFWDRAPSAVPAAPNSSVAASQGDYQLSPPHEAEPAGAGVTSPAGDAPGFTDFREDRSAYAPAAPAPDYNSDLGTDYDPFVIENSRPRYRAASAPVAYCAAVYQVNDELYQACVASAEPEPVEDRPGQPAAPADPGVGFSEYLPGEAGTRDASEDPGTACRELAGCNR